MGVPVAGTAVAVAVAVVFGLLLVVRISQGAPPAATWAELGDGSRGTAVALVGPGDHLHIAEPGDSYWSIAAALVPNEDRRPVVDALIAANGGSTSIEIGQRIVIPAELVSAD